MTPGEKIVELREMLNMNQTELAQKIEINRSVLNRIEQGTRPVRDDELKKLADFFRVSTDELLNRESPGKGYYLDPETARIANEMKEAPGKRVLFRAVADLPPDKIQQVKDYVDFITRDKSDD